MYRLREEEKMARIVSNLQADEERSNPGLDSVAIYAGNNITVDTVCRLDGE